MDRRRVVITGLGAVTPIGLTALESWQAVKAGTCGIAPITLYDASNMKAKLAGEVKDAADDAWEDAKELAGDIKDAAADAWEDAKDFAGDAKEVAAGYECGLGIENYNDVKEGDEIECFVMEEISR